MQISIIFIIEVESYSLYKLKKVVGETAPNVIFYYIDANNFIYFEDHTFGKQISKEFKKAKLKLQ